VLKIDPEGLELNETVVFVNRVSKVVKGGRRFGFSAMVVVGNGEGIVGIGYGKAKDVSEAIKKGASKAKKSLIKVRIKKGTIPYTIIGRYGAAKVFMKPASPGTRIIWSGTKPPLLIIFSTSIPSLFFLSTASLKITPVEITGILNSACNLFATVPFPPPGGPNKINLITFPFFLSQLSCFN